VRETPLPGVQESVVVERVILPGRVIDRRGNPIRGLRPEDLRLRVDGIEVPIEALDELNITPPAESDVAAPDRTAPSDRHLADAPGPMTRTSTTRNIVMLFQWEISGQKDSGFLRMMRQARLMVEQSAPEDRIAVLGYGSSLRLLQDFTDDREALYQAIRSIRNLNYRGQPPAGTLTLRDGIASCPPTGSVRKALICIGDSLQPIAVRSRCSSSAGPSGDPAATPGSWSTRRWSTRSASRGRPSSCSTSATATTGSREG
jgi:hypothetical protein